MREREEEGPEDSGGKVRKEALRGAGRSFGGRV